MLRKFLKRLFDLFRSPGDGTPVDPTPAPTPTPTPTTGDFDAKLLALHNQSRAANRLGPLRLVPILSGAADIETRAICSTGEFSHTPGGSQLTERLTAAGYTNWAGAAENIAAGYQTPEALMDGWMNSPPHRANILGNYTEVGFSQHSCTGAIYWAADFGSRAVSSGGTAVVQSDIRLSGPLYAPGTGS